MTDILLVGVESDLVDRVAALGGHRVVSIDRYTVHGGKHAGSGSTEPFDDASPPQSVAIASSVPLVPIARTGLCARIVSDSGERT